jgi:hypothetical protein
MALSIDYMLEFLDRMDFNCVDWVGSSNGRIRQKMFLAGGDGVGL